MKKEETIKQVASLYIFILLLWGFYRFLFRFPEEIEELFFKPLVWLLPTFYLVFKRKENLSSLGFSSKNLGFSLCLGLGLGAIFALEGLLAHSLKYQGFSFLWASFSLKFFLWSFFLALATAFSEETVFRGFIFSRLWQVLDSELKANLISSFAFSLVHLPITIFVFRLPFLAAVAFLILTFVFGVASSFSFARTKNLLSCFLIHILWAWPVMLFY